MIRYDQPPAIIWQLNEGISPESRTIQYLLQSVKEHASKPVTLGWQTVLKDQVQEVSTRCSEEGWDGYNANPISNSSRLWALRLIDQLPGNIQEPSIVPEPDGELALEWNLGKDRIFSLTVSGSRLIYAGIIGASRRLYGEEKFINELPKTITNTLSNYFLKA
jgi:hypothetical protein